jgi:hypothetical protein
VPQRLPRHDKLSDTHPGRDQHLLTREFARLSGPPFLSTSPHGVRTSISHAVSRTLSSMMPIYQVARIT